MKILLLGANGMLAQAITRVWHAHTIIPLDRPEIDLTDSQTIPGILDQHQPDVVVNCAAYTAVDTCETDEATATAINATAVGALALATAERNITMVHISTDYVFDGLKEAGYEEDDQTGNPQNAYGRTKLTGEKQFLANTSQGYLVRTSWLYGPGGKNFVTTMRSLGKTKPALRVINDQHGKPTYTIDLATFLLDLVEARAPFGIYHGVNEEATTWYDFAQEIFRLEHIQTPITPCPTEDYPTPAKRPHWSILLNTKRPALRPWSEALADYLHELNEQEGATL